MGTSLTGLTPGSTYPGLIKISDNSSLTTSLKVLSDGNGNDSPLKLSTAAVGVGSISNIETAINAKVSSGSNLGSTVGREGIFSAISSGDIQFKSLVAGSNVTLSSTASEITISATGGGGGVTSVDISSTTSGVTVGGGPITDSGTLTVDVATASSGANGLLSSTDWSTFNNKQDALPRIRATSP